MKKIRIVPHHRNNHKDRFCRNNIRFLQNTKQFDANKIYLIADWSVSAVSISIFSNGNVDFLRYQSIETSSRNWTYRTDETDNNIYSYNGNIEEYKIQLTDQVMELERILNFYRFSLHKGEKSVDTIILLGDNPEMESINRQMTNTVDTPIIVIDDAFVQQLYPQFSAKHCALIGLALKEESL